MKILEDFVFHQAVDDNVINNFRGKLPQEIINIWENYGFGSFLNGYLKLINPNEFQKLLDESYFASEVSVPIFTTGMADIITWEKNKYLKLVKYRKSDFHGIAAGFGFFLSDLLDSHFCERHLDWKPYLEVIKLTGIPDYDECYGYVPLLGLGGAKKAKNLQRMKLKEHIMAINELVGPIT